MSDKTSKRRRRVETPCITAPATGCTDPAEPDSKYKMCAYHTRLMQFLEPWMNRVANQLLKQIQDYVIEYVAQITGKALASPNQVKSKLLDPGGKALL